jgi:hypothetical protein
MAVDDEVRALAERRDERAHQRAFRRRDLSFSRAGFDRCGSPTRAAPDLLRREDRARSLRSPLGSCESAEPEKIAREEIGECLPGSRKGVVDGLADLAVGSAGDCRARERMRDRRIWSRGTRISSCSSGPAL